MIARSWRLATNSNGSTWPRATAIAFLISACWLLLTPSSTGATSDLDRGRASGQAAGSPANRLVDDGELLQIMNQQSIVAADGLLTIDVGIALDDLTAELELLESDEPANEDDDPETLNLEPTTSPLDQFTIEVIVFGRLTDEADVEEPPTRPLNRIDPIPLSQLEVVVDGIGRDLYRIELPVRSGESFDDQQRILIPEPGVYPITVELHDVDGLLATRVTHFIRLAQETSGEATIDPIPVALLLPVAAADGLTLQDTVALLSAHPTHPITVALEEGTESQLRSDPDLAARFVEAVGQRQVISSSNLDLDPSALAEIGQELVYSNAVTANKKRFAEMGVKIAPTMDIVDTPLTENGARVLHSIGTRTVIRSMDDEAGHFAWDRNRLQIIPIDNDLSATFATEDSGPVVATQVLAKLVLRGDSDQSPVLLGGAAMGQRPLAALNAFLVALSQPGAPRPVGLDELKHDTELQPAERPSQNLAPVTELLSEVLSRIATYESSYRAGGIPPQQFQDRMLASLSRDRNQQDRRSSLSLVAQQVNEELDVISLPVAQPVNLAARSAPIPLVVESRAKGPRLVMVKFVSDKVRVSPNEEVILVEPGISSIDVEVEARSLGVSPLEVSVWTPDGKRQLALTTFQVRSTAIPGVGLLLSSIFIVLLGSWWWVDSRRRRSERQSAKATSIALRMER